MIQGEWSENRLYPKKTCVQRGHFRLERRQAECLPTSLALVAQAISPALPTFDATPGDRSISRTWRIMFGRMRILSLLVLLGSPLCAQPAPKSIPPPGIAVPAADRAELE